MTSNVKIPHFLVIQQYVESHIMSGSWPPGTRIPSENELSKNFSVSRMTARRALTELSDKGLLKRSPGIGSFVRDPIIEAPKLGVPDVIAEGKQAGHLTCRVLRLDVVQADIGIAQRMQVPAESPMYVAVLLYCDNDMPIQIEEIFVNRDLAPAFIKQNYEKIIPTAYLEWLAKNHRSEYQVKATLASAFEKRELGLTKEGEEACMRVTRRIWVAGKVLSVSTKVNPSQIYKLGAEI